MARAIRIIPASATALFMLWVGLLAIRSDLAFPVPHAPDPIEHRLSTMRAALEKYHTVHGAYPPTGGSWVLVGDGARESEAVGTFPAGLATFPPFTDPAKSPTISIIYASDGKDFKLLAHVTDRRVCSQIHEKSPGLVDPARHVYIKGFQRGWSWNVEGDEMAAALEDLKKKQPSPWPDKSLNLYLRGTCWAFGFWTPGASEW